MAKYDKSLALDLKGLENIYNKKETLNGEELLEALKLLEQENRKLWSLEVYLNEKLRDQNS